MVARISSCYKTTRRIVQQTFAYVITCIRLRFKEPDTGIDCLSFFAHPSERIVRSFFRVSGRLAGSRSRGRSQGLEVMAVGADSRRVVCRLVLMAGETGFAGCYRPLMRLMAGLAERL